MKNDLTRLQKRKWLEQSKASLKDYSGCQERYLNFLIKNKICQYGIERRFGGVKADIGVNILDYLKEIVIFAYMVILSKRRR